MVRVTGSRGTRDTELVSVLSSLKHREPVMSWAGTDPLPAWKPGVQHQVVGGSDSFPRFRGPNLSLASLLAWRSWCPLSVLGIPWLVVTSLPFVKQHT